MRLKGWMMLFLIAVMVVVGVWVMASTMSECQDDGHSFLYCYQLLWGRR